jgi:hypothetical protein
MGLTGSTGSVYVALQKFIIEDLKGKGFRSKGL